MSAFQRSAKSRQVGNVSVYHTCVASFRYIKLNILYKASFLYNVTISREGHICVCPSTLSLCSGKKCRYHILCSVDCSREYCPLKYPKPIFQPCRYYFLLRRHLQRVLHFFDSIRQKLVLTENIICLLGQCHCNEVSASTRNVVIIGPILRISSPYSQFQEFSSRIASDFVKTPTFPNQHRSKASGDGADHHKKDHDFLPCFIKM